MSLVHLNHEAYAGGTVDALMKFPSSSGHKAVACLVWDATRHGTFAPTNIPFSTKGAGIVAEIRAVYACCTQISANPTSLSHLQGNQQDHLGRMPLISCLSWEDTLDSRQKTLYPTSRYAKTSACVSKDLTRSLF